MRPALITGFTAGLAYVLLGVARAGRDYHRELANRQAWNQYRSTH